MVRLAWAGIFLYPVGVSVFYAVLLLFARRALVEDKPTALSKALSFLVRDFDLDCMWWELLMAWRQLWLVGFAVLILPGSVEQLVISFLVALVYMLVCAVAMPFKDKGDDFFANACSFALVAVFFFCIVMKISVLTEEVDYVISGQLRGKYGFDVLLVTGGMIASILGSLLLTAAMATKQVIRAANMPTIRLLTTKAPPALLLLEGHRWHMFLSHIWGTGQDQCASIRRL